MKSASAEANPQMRYEYGALVKIFADRMRAKSVWRPYLESWEMWKSKVIAEWRDEGALRQQKVSMMDLLNARFSSDQIADLRELIDAESNIELLRQWFIAAIGSSDLAGIREVIAKSAPPSRQSRRTKPSSAQG